MRTRSVLLLTLLPLVAAVVFAASVYTVTVSATLVPTSTPATIIHLPLIMFPVAEYDTVEVAGFAIDYPALWYVTTFADADPSEQGRGYGLIISNAPGNVSPQYGTDDELARITVWSGYLSETTTLREWVITTWSWLDEQVQSADELLDGALRVRTLLGEDPSLQVDYLWAERDNYFFFVKGYAYVDNATLFTQDIWRAVSSFRFVPPTASIAGSSGTETILSETNQLLSMTTRIARRRDCSYGCSSKNPYYPEFYDQCTWLAAKERCDLRFPEGPAWEWADDARDCGYTVDTNPEVGAIAVWGKGIGGADPYKDCPTYPESCSGHVAYVISRADDKNFRVLENNWPIGEREQERDVTFVDGIQFIHKKENPLPPEGQETTSTESFRVVNPLRNIFVDSDSRFELAIDGEIILHGPRSSRVDRFARRGFLLWPGWHEATLTWWEFPGDSGATFSQTWWPNEQPHAAEYEPPLEISYTTLFSQLATRVGETVRIDVGAAVPGGELRVDSIDITVAGHHLVPHPSIIGPSGHILWDTTGWSPGEVVVTFSASVAGYDGATTTKSIPYELLPGDAPPPTPRCPRPPIVSAAPASAMQGDPVLIKAQSDSFECFRAMRLLLDGQVLYESTNPIWSYEWDTSSIIPGTYTLRVEVAGTQDEGWSNPSFRNVQVEILPPACRPPVLVSPADGATFSPGDQILLRWSGNCDEYLCEVWRGDETHDTDWTTSTEHWSPINTPGTVYWHVKCRCNGEETDWSQTRSYTVPDWPPCDTPQLVSPPTEQDFGIPCTVNLQWASDCAEYYVEWARNPSFIPVEGHSRWTSQTTYGSSFPSGTTPGKRYWHVKGRTAQGAVTNWSETWNFDLTSSTPIPPCSVPTLVDPPNGATFNWYAQIYLTWNGSCEEYRCDVSWSGGGCNSGWTRQKVYPACMPPPYEGGEVTWKVRGRNSAQVETAWSESRSYTVLPRPTLCDIPQLQSPPTGQDFVIPCTVNLQWASNCAEYYVEWARNPSFSPVEGHSPWTSQTTYALNYPEGSTQGKVYWHVKGRTAEAGETNWSETRNFDLISPTPPPPCPVPTLVDPPDGATFNCGAQIDLTWNGNCEEYWCDVSWSGGGCNSGWTRQKVYRACMPPPYEGGGVTWKVKGRNSALVETAWSESRSYTVLPCPTPIPRPDPPVPWYPPKGTHFSRGTQVALRWNAVSGASLYALEVWKTGYYWTQAGINNVEYPTQPLNDPGLYYWHVAAKYPNSDYSDWSENWYFYID